MSLIARISISPLNLTTSALSALLVF